MWAISCPSNAEITYYARHNKPIFNDFWRYNHVFQAYYIEKYAFYFPGVFHKTAGQTARKSAKILSQTAKKYGFRLTIECACAILLRLAVVAELADALDSGSSEKSCRFNSCQPHQNKGRPSRPLFSYIDGAGHQGGTTSQNNKNRMSRCLHRKEQSAIAKNDIPETDLLPCPRVLLIKRPRYGIIFLWNTKGSEKR